MTTNSHEDDTYDVVVLGAGAGGMATAITAAHEGLRVVIVEKSPYFGGTAAFSGGVLWIPGNPHGQAANPHDTRAKARRYLEHEAGEHFNARHVDAFLDKGPDMVRFFEAQTQVKFVPTLYPDYHPDVEGGAPVGRSILAAPYDIRALGPDMARLRPPLETITFFGMMFNSSNADIAHFFKATKSLTSAAYVTRRLVKHTLELLRYRRGINVTSGNALAARLGRSVLDRGIPILTDTRLVELLRDDTGVHGVRVSGPAGEQRLMARKAVVLGTGGFSHDTERRDQAYGHARAGHEHFSPVPADNTGDGARQAEAAGGHVDIRYTQPAAWMPVSKVPLSGGRHGAFPHLLDRYKPGIIGVNRQGRRFTNESNSYHDVGAAMAQQAAQGGEAAMWLICDQATLRKYGLGYAKPAPMPVGGLVRKGYLQRGRTLEELAQRAGIDPAGLAQTVADYNLHAREGRDPAFGRGTTAFNRYLADPAHTPNPCVGPIERGPYYALKLVMGDLGTFDGIETDVVGRVLARDGRPIPGLFAVGNDRASVMGGNYPAAGITLGPIMTFAYITGRFLAGIDDGLVQADGAASASGAAGNALGPGGAGPAATDDLAVTTVVPPGVQVKA